jgi:hypothetical protein
MQALSDARCLSAPVITGKADHGDKPVAIEDHADGDVLGFMDIRDILLHLLSTVGDLNSLLRAPMLKRMEILQSMATSFSTMVIKEVSAYGQDGNFLHSGKVCLICVHNSFSLQSAVPKAITQLHLVWHS